MLEKFPQVVSKSINQSIGGLGHLEVSCTFHCGCAEAWNKLAVWGAGQRAGKQVLQGSVCGTARWAGCCDAQGCVAPLGSAGQQKG